CPYICSAHPCSAPSAAPPWKTPRWSGAPTATQRYGSFRVLLGVMRFLGVIVLLIGALVFFSGLGDSRASASQSTALLVGAVVIAVVLFAAAGLFELLIDVEENTRSSFRLQQLILEE